jgi:hypothetical protein
MADPSLAPPLRPEPENSSAGRDFGGLARRIAGWTTNGLATALILVAGLTFGRQVLVWWRQEPVAPPARSAASPEGESGLQRLEFGALTGAVQARTVRGARDDVLTSLCGLCRPIDRPDGSVGFPPSDAERRLLLSLAGKEPAESGDGWRIDELPQGMPLVVCSTTAGDRRVPSTVPLQLRIVSIGLAVPADDGQWSAYAFRLDRSAAAPDRAAAFPLPAGSIRGMTLSQPDGTTMTTFREQASPAAWEDHFRTRPAKEGWQPRTHVPPGGRRHLEFEKAAVPKLRAEVHFEYDGQGELHGLLLVGPFDKP